MSALGGRLLLRPSRHTSFISLLYSTIKSVLWGLSSLLDNGLCLACQEVPVSGLYQTAQSKYFTIVGRITKGAGGKGMDVRHPSFI